MGDHDLRQPLPVRSCAGGLYATAEVHLMMAQLLGLKTISPKDLLALTAQGSVTVFDVNAFQSWERAHVPTARHLDPQRFEAAHLPADRNADLVFYCSNPLCRKA